MPALPEVARGIAAAAHVLHCNALLERVAGGWVTRAVCVAGHCDLQWGHSHVIQL